MPRELTVPARTEELPRVLAFVDGELERVGCPAGIQYQIDIAVEEIYVNIASYAYETQCGEATVRCAVEGEPLQITIQFLDRGRRYNPLEREEPDITLPAMDRGVGGLGILLVKRSMDDVAYEYREGKNILTIRKGLW